jgi:hypothetical protein
MANYKTAMGKVVDMTALTAKNEKTRAVGNMKVNARGDTIDAQGRIVKSATVKANDSYNRTVGNRSAQPVKSKSAPSKPKVDFSELTEMEREIEESYVDDLEVEKIKAQELKKK